MDFEIFSLIISLGIFILFFTLAKLLVKDSLKAVGLATGVYALITVVFFLLNLSLGYKDSIQLLSLESLPWPVWVFYMIPVMSGLLGSPTG